MTFALAVPPSQVAVNVAPCEPIASESTFTADVSAEEKPLVPVTVTVVQRLDDQVSAVCIAPSLTRVGVEEICMSGVKTVTSVFATAPEQLTEYPVFCASMPVGTVPLVAPPVLKPVPVHELAFVEDQVSAPATPDTFFPVVAKSGPLLVSVAAGEASATVTVHVPVACVPAASACGVVGPWKTTSAISAARPRSGKTVRAVFECMFIR